MPDAPNTPDIAEVARKLTKAQREAVLALDAQWAAGPDLPSSITSELGELRIGGLVRREFADMHDPAYAVSSASVAIRLAACWFFQLTPLGIAVSDYLKGQGS